MRARLERGVGAAGQRIERASRALASRAEGRVPVGTPRFQEHRLAKMIERGRRFFAVELHRAEVVPGLRQFRIHRQGVAIAVFGFIFLSAALQNHPEVDLCLRMPRLDLQRLAIAAFRVLEQTRVQAHHAAAEPIACRVRGIHE
ncbi:hypothetical protein D3C83_27360 [compost metagenome]